jgi:hypothetical protein
MKQVATALSIFVLLLAVYLWTMAPGNFWIDSAAFSTCNEIMGLPHSPSFPLYTVLGRAIHSMLPTSPATASNLYSAVVSALGGVIFYMILNTVLATLKISPGIKRTAAIAGSLFAFLTIPVWQSAVRAEVYSLQILLSLSVILLFIKSALSRDVSAGVRFGVAMVFFQGLSFVNHSLLAIITLPLIVGLPFCAGWRFTKSDLLKSAGFALIVFSLAISFYVYLPIRSQHDPTINSGQPKTAAAAFNAITRSGEDYLPAIESTEIDYLARAGKLGSFMFDQTGGLILLAMVAGAVEIARKRRKHLFALLVLIPFGLGLTIWAADFKMLNYDIVAYSGLTLIILSLFAFFGLGLVAQRLSNRGNIFRLIPILIMIPVVLQFTGNLYSCDLSSTHGPDRLAESILDNAPPNAILLLNEDNVVLPLWYQCFALGKRPDVAVISAGALYRPSYRGELQQLYPALEYPKEFDRYKIDDLNRAVSTFCRLNEKHHPILVQFGVPGINSAELAPHSFLFRYGRSNGDVEVNAGSRMIEILDGLGGSATDLLTKDFVARNAFNYGVYFDNLGQKESAYRLFQYAIDTDENNPDYLLRLGIAFLKAGKYNEAEMLLKEAAGTGEGCPEAESLLKQIADREYGKL